MATRTQVLAGLPQPVITDVIQGFDPGSVGLVAPLVAPRVTVPGEKATIMQFLNHETNMLYDNMEYTERAKLAEMDWDVASTTKQLKHYALRYRVGKGELAFATGSVQSYIGAGNFLAPVMAKKWEYDVANLLSTDTNYNAANKAIPAVKWNVAADTPIADVNTAINRIWAVTGENPTFMIIGWEVWQTMKLMTEFTGILANAERQILAPEVIGAYFDIPNVYIGLSSYWDPDPGVLANVRLWEQDSVILGITHPPGIGRPVPSLCYTYHNPTLMESSYWYDDDTHSHVWDTEDWWLVDMAANTYGYCLYEVCT